MHALPSAAPSSQSTTTTARIALARSQQPRSPYQSRRSRTAARRATRKNNQSGVAPVSDPTTLTSRSLCAALTPPRVAPRHVAPPSRVALDRAASATPSAPATENALVRTRTSPTRRRALTTYERERAPARHARHARQLTQHHALPPRTASRSSVAPAPLLDRLAAERDDVAALVVVVAAIVAAIAAVPAPWPCARAKPVCEREMR